METLNILAEKHREMERQISEGATLVRDLRHRHQEMEKHLHFPNPYTPSEPYTAR